MSDKDEPINKTLDILVNARKRSILPNVPEQVQAKISKSNGHQERINRLNAAMLKFIEFTYEKNGSEFTNMDAFGMISITAPFTKSGYRDYVITATEGRALALIVKESQKLTEPEPLLIYKPGYTRWFLQFDRYRNAGQAVTWLQALKINERFLRAWRQVSCQRYSGEAMSPKTAIAP